MEALLKPYHYTDDSHFNLEQQKLSRNTWHFVACMSDLTEPNSYVTATIGGQPIVIQRFPNGEISALSNICRHRYSMLQNSKFGNRSLVCPYHGWTYDAKGKLQGIPCRQSFPELASKSQAGEIRQPKYALGICGNLVFVANEDIGISLNNYLGASFEKMENLSNAFGLRIDRNELLIDANWKIIVENTLEAYHVAKVHEFSFHKLGLNSLRHNFVGPHSTMEAQLESSSQKDFDKIAKHFSSRPQSFDGYFHQMLFPCMTFATTGGLSFAVQEIEPISAGRTRFTSHVFLSSYEGKRKTALEDALATTIVKFNRQVFEEDRWICESVHSGAKKSDFPAILGTSEERIFQFQKHYLSYLE